MKLASIDIGTNTTLLLVAEGSGATDVQVLDERAEITRLGRGIGADCCLGEAGIERTLAVLRDYAAIARGHGAQIRAIGTEALRRATNSDEFLRPAAEILGGPIEVIDGQREAALTFLAAVTSFPALAQQPLMVIDIGGGSTEVVISEAGQVSTRVSLPLGAVRLTERFVRHDPPLVEEAAAIDAAIAAQLVDVPCRARDGRALALIGTAGTVTTLAAMALDLAVWDPERVHGHRLDRTALFAQIARLGTATQAAREGMAGLDPRRADVIFAGARILAALVEHVQASQVVISDRGIRWGLLFEALARPPGEV